MSTWAGDSPAREVEDDASGEVFPREVDGGGIRKKAQEVRAWLVVDVAGRVHQLEAGKHVIMRRTGLPGRDIRMLDPLLSYPSTIVGRDRAVVIRLEHIKAIIMAREVLLFDYQDPSVIPFVDQIQTRILRHYHAVRPQATGDGEGTNGIDMNTIGGPENDPGSFSSKEDVEEEEVARDGAKLLPFEFVALEACLEAACGCLENEAKTLELEALPALDKLTSEISTLNLERVRQIKSRLVSITGRVQKVRDELHNLLDDDQDMADMFLTQKLQDFADCTADEKLLSKTSSNSIAPGIDLWGIDRRTEQTFGASITSSRFSHFSKQINVEELERLLEPYFVQVGGTLDMLSTLREYVDDTEDYLNMMLDDMQNQMLRLGIMVVTAAMLMEGFMALTGIMAENIGNPLYHDTASGNRNVTLLVVVSTVACFVSYAMFYFWFKHKGLLE